MRKGFTLKLENKSAYEKLITAVNGLLNALQISVYYTHPYFSREKGSVEKFNGLIRKFIPKGCDISKISDTKILEVENYSNTLSRKVLDWKKQNDFFNECFISFCI